MTAMIRGLLAATALASLATTAFAEDVQGVIGGLPTELKAQYDGAPQKVLASAWDNFTPPPKPWKWCHSESYQGNPWRVTVTKELKRLVDGLIADGTVSSFEVSDSNNDASQQINQIRAFIDKKCSIITSIPGSATALDDAIDAAAKAGIPFITAAGSVTSPNAINVDSNYARWGYDMMTAIGKAQPDGASILLPDGRGPIELTLSGDIAFDGIERGSNERFSGRAGGGSSVTLYDRDGGDYFQYAVGTEIDRI